MFNQFSYCIIFFLSIHLSANSQTYNIATNNGQTFNTCSGNFYDSGGGAGSYSNNENYTITFCSSSGLPLMFDFFSSGSFDVDCAGDSLFFYNGPSAVGTPIAVLTYLDDNTQTTYSSQLQINTSSACVTIKWKSNGACTDAGWNASISCGSGPACSGNPPAADIFGQATPICNLSSYCGTTASYYAEDTPYNLIGGGTCPIPDDAIFGGTIENNSWLSFQAVTNTASFNFTTGNCGGGGIQVGIFGFNGSTFSLQSPCSITDGSQTGSFSVNATGLTPGSTYYIMIDGNAGAICDYTITANTGVATITAGPDQIICTTSTTMAASTPPSGSGTWTVVSGSGTFANPNNPTSTVSGLSVGANVFTWTYASGPCATVSDNVTINVTNGNVPLISYNSPFCSSLTNAQPVTLSGTSGGSYSSTTGLSINTSTGAITPSASTPGNYTVTYTVAGACSPGTTTVVINSNISPTFSIDTNICSGSTAPILPTTSTNGITGTWSPSSVSNTFANTYTFSPSTNQCASATSISTTISSIVNPTFTKTSTNVTCVGPNTATISFTSVIAGSTINWVSGPVTSPIPTGNLPGGATNEFSLINLPAGTYCADITGPANTCTATIQECTIISPPSGVNPVTGFSYSSPICANSTDPAPIGVSGFTSGGNYSSTSGLSINSSTGVINLANSTPGTYTVTYTLAATGCTNSGSGTASITINPITIPVTSFSYVSPICSGASNTLPSLSSGFETGGVFSSTSGLTINSTTGEIDLTLSTAGTYTVTYSLVANGCMSAGSSTFSVSIQSSTTPITTFSYPSPICINSINTNPILASGFTTGGTFSAGSGIIVNSSTGVIDLSLSNPGTYTINYTVAASSCASAGNGLSVIVIDPLSTPNTNFTYATPVCLSGNNPVPILASGFTTGGTFSSTTGIVINSVTGEIDLNQSSPGTYTITYSVTPVGCFTSGIGTFSISISNANTPVTNFNYNGPYCLNALNPSPTLSAGFTNGGFFSSSSGLSLDSNSGIIDLAGSLTGTYIVTYQIAASGCTLAGSGSTTVLLLSPPASTSAISGNTPICPNANAQVFSVTNNAGSTYTWTVPADAIISIGQGTNSVTVDWGSTAGNITVVETNICGSANPVSLNVNLTNIITTSTINGPVSVCPNTSGLNYSVQNVNAGSSFNWVASGGTIISGNGTASVVINWGGIGNASVSVTETTTCGLNTTQTLSVIISSPPVAPVIQSIEDTICTNSGNVVYFVNNNPTSNYAWTVPLGATIMSGQGTNNIFVNWGTIGGNVTVTEISICGNGALASYPVTILTPPSTASIFGPDTLCSGANQLNYSTNNTTGNIYNWSINGGTIVSGQNTNSIVTNWLSGPTGTLSVTQSNKCGTSSPATYIVSIINVQISPSNDITICKGQSAQLFVSGNANSFSWSPSQSLDNSFITNPLATPNETTQYIVSSLGQCSKSDTVNVNVIEIKKPSFEIYSEQGNLINENNIFINTTGEASYTYNWNFGDNSNMINSYNSEHVYYDTSLYLVVLTATNDLNCIDTAIKILKIQEPYAVYIPNSFTPNDDLTNDVFKPYFRNYKKLDAYIYDRWGNKIYEWHTLNGGWDGKINGIDAQQDVYVYLIELFKEENQNKYSIRREGTVTLLR